ncbi:MAG: hypothetical protein ACRDT4_15685 [Micromonosporaceae bacterium]
MSEALAVRAEIEKLARLLETSPEALAYLQALPPQTIRGVRRRVSDVLFDASRDLLQRLAAATKLVPSATVAMAGRRFFGPLLSARIAALLEPARAAEVAERLSPKFLAEVCLHLDPRRAAGIIARIPLATIVEVARELIARREYVTLGQFVGYISTDALTSCVTLAGPDDLLRIAFFIEEPEHLDAVVDTVSDERIADVVRAAATGEDGWPYAFSLLDRVTGDRHGRLADIAVAQDDGVLVSMLDAVHADGLYSSLLPLLAAMSEASRRRLVGVPAIHKADRISAIVAATAEYDLWPALLTVAEQMPPATRATLLGLLADVDETVIESFVDVAVSEELIDRALAVLQSVPEADLRPVLHRIAELDPDLRRRLLDRARDLGHLDQLGPITAALDAPESAGREARAFEGSLTDGLDPHEDWNDVL